MKVALLSVLVFRINSHDGFVVCSLYPLTQRTCLGLVREHILWAYSNLMSFTPAWHPDHKNYKISSKGLWNHNFKVLPSLLHEEMQPDITHSSEKDEKDTKQRDIRPPEWLGNKYEHSDHHTWSIIELTCALRPNVDKIVAAGTSSSTPYLTSFNCRYLNSFTARASNAAWKKEIVCNHWNATGTVSRLIKRPVNMRLYREVFFSKNVTQIPNKRTWTTWPRSRPD